MRTIIFVININSSYMNRIAHIAHLVGSLLLLYDIKHGMQQNKFK
jgi:hypothetical protein